MEIVLFWILWAILNAIIAHSKNRNVGGWALGGLLAGFFTTIILICLSPLPKESNHDA